MQGGVRLSRMRVMTFNLRFENDRDGDNAWVNRRELVVHLIRRYRPDILGTQEGKWPQLAYLRDHLHGYQAHLPDRAPEEKTQCPTLFIREERFAVESGRDFWLSKTPDVHLSKDWDSAFPRMMSFAMLRGHKKQKNLKAAVTHLDHMGEEARYQQARIVAEWAAGQEFPVIVMGDFNEGPASSVHKVLTGLPAGLTDTWEALACPEDEESFTHHGFNGVPQRARMDWILVSSHFEVLDAAIIRDSYNGSYPSDHYPYMCDLELSEG